MNTMTKLLKYLDDVFGFKNGKPELKSTVRKISQKYDDQASVHIITFEYRCKSYDGGRVTKKNRDKSLLSSILR